MAADSQQNFERPPPVADSARAVFRVDELDCAEEVLLLQSELQNAAGVHDLAFDVLKSRMTVTFDPQKISPEDVIVRVSGLGMHATQWESAQRAAPQSTRRWSVRTLLTTVATGFLLLGFGWHWFATGDVRAAWGYHGEGDAAIVLWPTRLAYLLAVTGGLWLVAPKAWSAARRLRPDMNLLMTLAVIGALLLGEWMEAATVSVLFSIALLLEHWSLGRARRAIAALMKLAPETARCVQSHGDHEHEHDRPVSEVGIGTIIRVFPGERVPLDGRLTSGQTSVDQAPITGESVPVAKTLGDEVFAGTINQEGTVDVEVTATADRTALSRILQMVEEAQSRRAPAEQWVETFARYYTPAMLALALAIAVVPPLVLAASWHIWAYNGLVVLVIACPCALVISTPVSVVSALTSATRNGVLIKGGRFLEAAARIDALALDKTGTVTHGQPVVQQIIPLNGHTPNELLERAAAMEAHSRHPLARAILRRAEADSIPVVPPGEYRLLAGLGAEGLFAGKPFWIGSHRLLHERIEEPPEVHEQAVAMEDAGHTVVAVGNDEHICGLIGVADSVREEVAETVAELRRIGIKRIVMLTGDNEQTAREVARAAGIDEFHAELLPADKVRHVEQLRRDCRSVGMVGDGINDAPAMATATLGIAMGGQGVEAAIETADIALMSDELAQIPWLILHGRRMLNIIRQNIAFALGIKALFLVLTLAGMASLWMAIAADTGASLLVIFNGLRLLKTT